MFFRFRNILSRNMLSRNMLSRNMLSRNMLSKHLINKRFFSNNCNNECKINIEEFNSVKNMITYILITNTINYFITFLILFK
jgi:hypothetical protein